jgi:cell division septum initiation protein DivIVA
MTDQNICQYCIKKFSSKGNTKKHENICKKNPNILPKKTKKNNCFDKLYSIVEGQQKEIDDQKKEIESLKNKLKKTKKTSTTTNNNNITIFNTTQSLKDIIASLQPIDFTKVKEEFETKLSNNYIDKGIAGIAQFICDVPCQNKFITTDYGRKMILFKTSEEQLVADPKASILLNTAIKQNADTIIDKAEDRYQYYISQIREAREDDIEPDNIDVEKKNQTKSLKTLVQGVKNNIPIDVPNATNVMILKGMENKVTNNAIE